MATLLHCNLLAPAGHAQLYEKLVSELTDCKRRPSDVVEPFPPTQRSIVLAVTGRPAAGGQKAAAGQELLDHWREIETGGREAEQGQGMGGRS